jgi:hypothetical protein
MDASELENRDDRLFEGVGDEIVWTTGLIGVCGLIIFVYLIKEYIRTATRDNIHPQQVMIIIKSSLQEGLRTVRFYRRKLSRELESNLEKPIIMKRKGREMSGKITKGLMQSSTSAQSVLVQSLILLTLTVVTSSAPNVCWLTGMLIDGQPLADALSAEGK